MRREIAALGLHPTPFGSAMVSSVGMLGLPQGFAPLAWRYDVPALVLVLATLTAIVMIATPLIVTLIAPGFTDTSMAGDYLDSRGGEELLADIPLGRVATPNEIATMAVFCAPVTSVPAATPIATDPVLAIVEPAPAPWPTATESATCQAGTGSRPAIRSTVTKGPRGGTKLSATATVEFAQTGQL